MSWSWTGQGCRTTFPQISLSGYGSVRSTEMTWGETGGRVAHASTRCIPAGKSNWRPEMLLILTCQGKSILFTESMSQQDPVSLIYCKYYINNLPFLLYCTNWACPAQQGSCVLYCYLSLFGFVLLSFNLHSFLCSLLLTYCAFQWFVYLALSYTKSSLMRTWRGCKGNRPRAVMNWRMSLQGNYRLLGCLFVWIKPLSLIVTLLLWNNIIDNFLVGILCRTFL